MKWFLNSQWLAWLAMTWFFAWATWGLFGFIDSNVGDLRIDPDGEHGYE